MFNKARLITLFLVFILSISPSIGIVTAATNVPLSGALVLADGHEGNSYSVTNASGQYLIDQGLKTGTYNMTATFPGYINQDLSKITVEAGVETPNINFLLLRSGGVSGKVTDSGTGQGLKDVMVFALTKTGSGFYSTTDIDGNYKIITNLETGTYNVTVSSPKGYISNKVTDVSVTAGVETKNVNLALAKSGVITGKVTAATGGQPLEGITVTANGGDVESFGLAQTDVNGNYRIDTGLGTGRYNVTTSFPQGYISNAGVKISVTVGVETGNVNLALAKSGAITGKITSTVGGQPLKGINIFASGNDVEGMGSAQTDVNGNYRIDTGLETGSYAVTAISGINTNSVPNVSVTVGQETANVNMTLTITQTPSGTIKGRVTDNKNKGVSEAQVSASGDAGTDSNTTDDEGYYVISDGLGTGTYTVSVTALGYIDSEKTDVSVTAGIITSDVNFKLESLPAEQSGKVSGTVLGEADPLVGKKASTISCIVDKATINAGESLTASGIINPAVSGTTVSLTFKKDATSVPATATTGADGKYSSAYSPASAGSWSVTASWLGDTVYYGAASQPAAFTVNEEAAKGNLTVIAKDSSGAVISGASVSSTTQPSGQTALSGTTTTDGSITFNGVKPGSYTIQAVKTDLTTATGTQTVASGNTATITLTLQISTTGDLKVTVKDSSGAVISGASVSSTTQPSGQTALSGTTTTDGSITFNGVKLGAYTIQASKTGFTSATGTGSAVTGSATAISITLQTQTGGGGIPSFPIEATILSILLAIALLVAFRKQ